LTITNTTVTLDNDSGDKPTRALQVLSVKPCIADENTEIRFLHDGGWRVDTITVQ
jgi:hypothetical protein